MKPETMSREVFRAQLQKIMPGLKWVVRLRLPLHATGSISSGSNRLCSVTVERDTRDDYRLFRAAMWLGMPKAGPKYVDNAHGLTVTQALRSLQDTLERQERFYGTGARRLECARQRPPLAVRMQRDIDRACAVEGDA